MNASLEPSGNGGNPESTEAQLKRMRMRSWRRGIKEMDMVLGPYADDRLATMSAADLALFDALLHENDQDIYPWITGAAPVPSQYADLIAVLKAETVRRNGG